MQELVDRLARERTGHMECQEAKKSLQQQLEAERSQTTEAAITTDLAGHLYAVIGEPAEDKRVVRIWYHPFVAFIWIGALLMALGGALGLAGRVGRRSHAVSGARA